MTRPPLTRPGMPDSDVTRPDDSQTVGYQPKPPREGPPLAPEYADGGDLHKWLGGRVLPVEAAVKLVYTLARAVGAAHQKGIVHRDIKPANILVTKDGVPKVGDFGLAKQFGEDNLTTTGA